MGVKSKPPNMIGVLLISLVCLHSQVSSEPLDTLNVHLNFDSVEHPGNPEVPGTQVIDLDTLCKDVDCEGKRTTLTVSCCKSKNRGFIGQNRSINRNKPDTKIEDACTSINCGNRQGASSIALACCKRRLLHLHHPHLLQLHLNIRQPLTLLLDDQQSCLQSHGNRPPRGPSPQLLRPPSPIRSFRISALL